jgi:hypothetical protein
MPLGRGVQSQGIVSFRAIATHLTELGIPTTGSHDRLGRPTGHESRWTGVQVSQVIARLNGLSACGYC